MGGKSISAQPLIPENLPEGLWFDGDRGIVVEGLVARSLVDHPVGWRPARGYDSCAFNELAGNTALAMFLGEFEPGGTKCGHRHFDETLMYVVSGYGWSEFRQDDAKPMSRIEWAAGDLLSIPLNCWHEHFNGASDGRARMLSFKTAPLMKRLVGSGEDVAHVRMRERYDDEPDYFEVRYRDSRGRMVVNFARSIGEDALPEPDTSLGHRVAIQQYAMGGHRTLDVSLMAIGVGGHVRHHCSAGEEAFVVLEGVGQTEVWRPGGPSHVVRWRAGDLFSTPLNVWRRHANTGDGEVRLLRVRSTFIQEGLGTGAASELELSLPDRFPEVVDPRGVVEPDGRRLRI